LIAFFCHHIFISCIPTAGIATARTVKLSTGDLLMPIASPEGIRYLVLFEYIIWTLGNAATHVNIWGSHIYLSNKVIEAELHSLRRNMLQIPS
jgi:hypothetical protein